MKKPKILLINPPLSGSEKADIDLIKIPLGISYLAAYVESKGYEVKVIDGMSEYKKKRPISNGFYEYGMTQKEIANIIKKFNPGIVGIHCAYTTHEIDAMKIAEIVKKCNKNIFVVFGGAHTSANPRSVLSNGDVDIAVIGEGELTFYEICENFFNGKSMKNIIGTAIKVKNEIKINPRRPLIKDLDVLPMPAYHLMPMHKYFEHFHNSHWAMRSPCADIITSRGCPMNCVFCSVQTIWGRTWRERSAKNVVDEIEFLVKNYGVKQIRMQDDNISWSKNRLMEICNEIIRRKINIKWNTPNGIAIWTLDEEVLRLMKRSGYYMATFGIESGDKETLKFIGKPINHEFAKNIIKICQKLGIWTYSTFIIGFPYETMKSIRRTADFAKDSGVDFALFYVAQPYAGTRMYEIYKKEGLLKEIKKSSVNVTAYNTKYFSANDLRRIRAGIEKEFIIAQFIRSLNPINLYYMYLNKIRSFEDFKYLIKLSKNLILKATFGKN